MSRDDVTVFTQNSRICSYLGQFSVPSLKNKRIHPEKNFLYFLKKICPKELLTYSNGAWFHLLPKLFTPWKKIIKIFQPQARKIKTTLKKMSVFPAPSPKNKKTQPKKISYTFLKKNSHWKYFLYFPKKNLPFQDDCWSRHKVKKSFILWYDRSLSVE